MAHPKQRAFATQTGKSLGQTRFGPAVPFCSFASHCDESQQPLAAPPIDVSSEAHTHRLILAE